MKNKIIIFVFILLLVFSTSIFATDAITTSLDNEEPKIIKSDLFEAKDTYILDGEIDGNVFNYSDKFEMLDSSILKGNLFLTSNNVTLKSNVSYLDTLSKDGELDINKINSSAVINGNAIIICSELNIESGVEIFGDLYVIAKKVNIQKSSIIHGNIFATCEDISLNGRVENSVYVKAKTFNMNYYGSIYKDLKLYAETTNLNSVIRRNSVILSKQISTDSDFLIYGDLKVDANFFDFSGEVDGNASINSKKLNFINSKDNADIKCLIKGNLDYSTLEEMNINASIVNGKVNYSNYKEKQIHPSFTLKSFMLNLLSFVIYVLVVASIFILINKNYLLKSHEIKALNSLSHFGIGLLSFFAVIFVSILLALTNIGITLSFVLVFAYIFLLFLSIPLLVLDIAILLSKKINVYLAILLVALVLFLISEIPYLGAFVVFLFITTGTGRIIRKLISNKQ